MSSNAWPDMTDVDGARYRFTGYQLPLIMLDQTGLAYVYILPHPALGWEPPSDMTGGFSNGGAVGDVTVNDGEAFPELPVDEA